MQPVRIAICEDHDITADGLRVLISYHPQFTVVGQAKNCADLLALLSENSVDILILDLNLGVEDGFGILAKVRTTYPNLLVLILTMYDDDHLIAKAKLAKANGYLLKNISSVELFDALKKLNHSSFFEDPKAFLQRNKVVGQRDSFVEKMKLTKREAEIVTLVAKGKDAMTISEELYLSQNTVLTHKKNIMKKLGLVSTADLVRFAFENKLV